MKDKSKGALLVFLGATLFSIGGVCTKFSTWNGFSVNGARSMLAVIVIGAYIVITKHRLVFNKRTAMGAVLLFLTTTLCTLGNKMTTAANTIVLQYAAPIYVVLFMWIFRKQRPKGLDIAACVLVFAGLVCFVVDGLSVGGMTGNILAALSGVTYAGFCITGADEKADSISMIFFGFCIGTATEAPFIAAETDFSTMNILMMLALGVFQMGTAYILFGRGLALAGAVTSSLVSGIEPILNPIWVALLYKESMGTMAVIGAVIVIGAILTYNVLNARLARKEAKETSSTGE